MNVAQKIETVRYPRRLERVFRYVEEHWLPVNPEVLRRVYQQVDSGALKDIDALADELLSDLGLFTFCIKELAEKLQKDGVDLTSMRSAADILRSAETDDVLSVLERSRRLTARNRLELLNDHQASLLAGMMISVSAVKLIAQDGVCDPEAATSAAITRQLGLALVACNYPLVFQDAVASLSEGLEITEAITRLIGVSPELLAVRVVHEWLPGLDLASLFAAPRDGKRSKSVEALRHICDVGEALARVNSPELYPDSHHGWQKTLVELDQFLGAGGIDRVQRHVAQTYGHCIGSWPGLFQGLEDLHSQTHSAQEENEDALLECLQDESLPHLFRSSLQELYTKLSPGEISRDAVRYLLNEVLPAAGFDGARVYVVDPSTCRLIPRVSRGRIERVADESLLCDPRVLQSHPVVDAFESQGLVSETVIDYYPGKPSYFAHALGRRKKAGVLYIEYLVSNNVVDQENRKKIFMVLREALQDVLKL